MTGQEWITLPIRGQGEAAQTVRGQIRAKRPGHHSEPVRPDLIKMAPPGERAGTMLMER